MTSDVIRCVNFDRFTSRQCICQPRSQGLSSLPLLVVGRKTRVAVGHVTTQNLGGKNISGGRGGRVIRLVDGTNFVSFKSSSSR